MNDKYKLSYLDEVRQQLDPSMPLAFDIETYNKTKHYEGGLYGSIRLAQFKQKGWDKALICDLKIGADAGDIQGLRDIIHTHGETAPIVGHNLSYEFQTMQEMDGNRYRRLPRYIADTMFLMREAYPLQGSHSLDSFYMTTLGFDPYEEAGINKKEMQKIDWSGLIGFDALMYSALDVHYLPEAYSIVMEIIDGLEQSDPLVKMRLQNATLAIDAGLIMQATGFRVDFDRAIPQVKEWKNTADTTLAKMRELGLPADKTPSSPPVTAKFLGRGASDKYTLAFGKYRDNDEKCSLVLDWRGADYRLRLMERWSSLTTTFGKVGGKFSPTTKTGRYSSQQENMQNSPRDMKPYIIPADEKSWFIGFDFAQIELRTMCALTGEAYMYEVFKEGGDIHQKTQDACRLDKRVIAKNVNFGLQYGMGIETFQKQLVLGGTYLPLDRLGEIKQAFMEQNPSIIRYHRQTGSNCFNGIPNRSLLGQPFWSRSFTEMVNRPNQASGTNEILKEFFRLCYEDNIMQAPDIRLALSVHDSVLFELRLPDKVKLEDVQPYIILIGVLAQRAWHNVLDLGYCHGTSYYNDVPMPIEVGFGKNWGEVDKGEALTIPENYVLHNDVYGYRNEVYDWRIGNGYIKNKHRSDSTWDYKQRTG